MCLTGISFRIRNLLGTMANKKTKKKEDLQHKEVEPEKILAHRQYGSRVQYLVEWKGFLKPTPTWELAEKFTQAYPGLIKEFLENQETDSESDEHKKDRGQASLHRRGKKGISKGDPKGISKKPQDLAQSLEAEKILDAEKTKEGLKFLVKWKNSDKADLVPSKEANTKWPQLVICFYESRLKCKPIED